MISHKKPNSFYILKYTADLASFTHPGHWALSPRWPLASSFCGVRLGFGRPGRRRARPRRYFPRPASPRPQATSSSSPPPAQLSQTPAEGQQCIPNGFSMISVQYTHSIGNKACLHQFQHNYIMDQNNKQQQRLNFWSMLGLPQHCCSKRCCSSLAHLLHGQWRRSEGRSPYGAAASRWPSVCHRRRAQTYSCGQPEHTVSTSWLKKVIYLLVKLSRATTLKIQI